MVAQIVALLERINKGCVKFVISCWEKSQTATQVG